MSRALVKCREPSLSFVSPAGRRAPKLRILRGKPVRLAICGAWHAPCARAGNDAASITRFRSTPRTGQGEQGDATRHDSHNGPGHRSTDPRRDRTGGRSEPRAGEHGAGGGQGRESREGRQGPSSREGAESRQGPQSREGAESREGPQEQQGQVPKFWGS